MIGTQSDITGHKTTELALREKTTQLHTLSRRILETQEAERRRVAHELHDELGQALTAIKINLQLGDRLQNQSPDELNAENLRIVDDALQQVRRLALALRPSMLDDLGLLPALRWMAGQSAERSGYTVEFDTAIIGGRLALEIETACFRIVQESLTNIARHAQAQHVKIALHRTGGVLELSVHDDGCGFDLAAMRERAVIGGSVGVLGMQERAELIGGQLDIESTPGQGSTVRLRCPLRRRGESA
jgi:signal transduction histidine kinase